MLVLGKSYENCLKRIAHTRQVRVIDARIIQADWRVIVEKADAMALDDCLRLTKGS